MSNPLFIIGHAKSGTTLLTCLLDSHPQLTVIPEETNYYLAPQKLPLEHPANDCRYWVEKTPRHIYHIKEIKKDFPNAKFIFIYRDPRDNYIAYKKKHGNNINSVSFSIAWSECISIAQKLNDVLFVKYESLVSSPEQVIDEMVNFLRIDFLPILLIPTKNGKQWHGNSMFDAVKNGIDSSGIGRYKKIMTKNDLMTIEALCKKSMIKYGYYLDTKSSAIKPMIKKYLFKFGCSLYKNLPYRFKKAKSIYKFSLLK